MLVGVGVIVAVATLVGIPARATYSAHTSADEPQYLLSALSLAEDGDLDIADERYSGAYRAFHEATLPAQTELRPDRSRLSPHNPLLPALLAVPMAIGGWVAAKATLAALAGILAALLAWIAVRRLGLPATFTAIGVVIFAVSPPMAFYATQVYPELPAALGVTIAVALLTGPPSPQSAAGIVVAIVALPWLAVKYVFVAAVIGVIGIWRHRASPATVAGLVVAWAAMGALYVGFNQAVYGGWTPYAAGDHFVGGELTAIGPNPDYAARSQRLLGLWVDRRFGLATWQPAYLLGLPALAWAVRRSTSPWRSLAGIVGVGWLVATFVAQTMHGWWWPGRQVVVVLPALVLLMLAWVHAAVIPLLPLAAVSLIGVTTFLVLATEAAAGTLALIVDFDRTSHPFVRGWSALLPDYLDPTTTTWVLHALWMLVATALAAWGWRTATPPTRPSSTYSGFGAACS